MSPEQVRGAKLTAQSDLFSLGVVLFELFTGKNPFLKENVSLTLNEINSFEESSLIEKIVEAQGVNNILLRLLKKNVNNRYNSAEEVLDELNVMIDQPSIVVNSVDRDGRQSRLAWLFLLVIILIIAGIIFYPKEKNQKQNELSENSSPSTQQQGIQTQQKNIINPLQKEPLKTDVNQNSVNQPIENNQKQNEVINPQKQDTNPANNNSNPVGIGSLDVQSIPTNAEIFINGESIGRTPFNRPYPLKTGEYSVKFVHPDCPIYYKTVTVNADEVTKLHVNIEFETKAFIYCQAFPMVGDIYINGNLKAALPMKTNDFIKVAPGAINLIIKNPRFKNIDTSFVLHARDTVRLRLKFKNE
jgi:serine/threonine-protein kinase